MEHSETLGKRLANVKFRFRYGLESRNFY